LTVATILFIKTAKFTLGITDPAGAAVEFQGDAADVHVEVEAGDVVTYPTLDGAVASNSEPETYSLVMRAGQDYSATGLARFLWDNKGAIADVVVNAHGQTATATADTPQIEGQVTLIPVAYGGEVGAFAEFEVTLPFVTTPALVAGP
jgi:hypothetical protein